MTPGFHRLTGIGAPGAATAAGASSLVSRLSGFMMGAFAAYAVLSLIRHEEPRVGRLLEQKGESEGNGRSLEELIADKERLEDMIAEVAAREAGG